MFSIYYHTPQGPVEPKKNERRHAAGPRALRRRDPLRNSLLSRKECRKQRPPRSSVRCRRGGGANKKNTVGLEEQAGVCVLVGHLTDVVSVRQLKQTVVDGATNSSTAVGQVSCHSVLRSPGRALQRRTFRLVTQRLKMTSSLADALSNSRGSWSPENVFVDKINLKFYGGSLNVVSSWYTEKTIEF